MSDFWISVILMISMAICASVCLVIKWLVYPLEEIVDKRKNDFQ